MTLRAGRTGVSAGDGAPLPNLTTTGEMAPRDRAAEIFIAMLERMMSGRQRSHATLYAIAQNRAVVKRGLILANSPRQFLRK